MRTLIRIALVAVLCVAMLVLGMQISNNKHRTQGQGEVAEASSSLVEVKGGKVRKDNRKEVVIPAIKAGKVVMKTTASTRQREQELREQIAKQMKEEGR
jgi:hypothetical protein